METKQGLLVDAFADEPMGGVPVPVVLDAVSESQLRSIAGEFGAPGGATLRDGELLFVERGDASAVVGAGVASCVGLRERGLLDAGTHTMTAVDSVGSEREYTVELQQDRGVRVELPEQSVDEAVVGADRLAPALGIDGAALRDVGADLPVGRVDEFDGTLLVPVNFLEHLGNATPDGETLAAVLAETDTARLCAFTFDTLGRETDLHARIFDPTADGCERPASGVAAAGCGRHLSRHGVFDGERARVRVECGQFIDRPGTVVATLEHRPQVGGRALTTLDGTLTVPEDDSDDIIEV